MKPIEIITQLLEGNHLSNSELAQAETILQRLNNEIKNRKPEVINFKKINHDFYGNPRYVCHFLNIDKDYQTAIKKAKAIGGRKFNNKQYGGGIVFSTYNLENLNRNILNLKNNF